MRSLIACTAVLVVALCLGAAPAAPAAAGEPEKLSEEGFVPIFNGKDLTGWDGNPKLWSAKDGVVRGETTVENPAKGNTFIIWRGGTLEDFELRLSFRIRSGNSGVQYRSKDYGNWVVGGYQAEVSNKPGSDGFIYDERGKRGVMCGVGQKTVWTNEGKKEVTGSVGDLDKIKAAFKVDDWNDYRIIAQGNHIVHYINGVQTIDFTDNDEKNRATSGILALQIHAGPPMVVEFRAIRLKKLPPAAAKPEAAKTETK